MKLQHYVPSTKPHHELKEFFLNPPISEASTWPLVLTLVILEYLNNPWHDLFYSNDSVSPSRNGHHVEHFQETFLNVLSHLEQTPDAPIVVNLLSSKSFTSEADEKPNQVTFANGLEALESLILKGVNISYQAHIYVPRSHYMYNLLEHIDNVQLRKNPQLLPNLKNILHRLPSTEEFIFDSVDYQILLECLDAKMMPPSQLARHFSAYDEPPIHYFEQESKHISLVLLSRNYRAKKISNKIAQYRQEAFELEQRQQAGFSMAALTAQINQSIVLPTVLIHLIGEYALGVDIIILAKILLRQLESLKKKYIKRFAAFDAEPKVLNILEEALEAAAHKKHLKICWDGRNTHEMGNEKEFAWDATKVIARLITGTQIEYGSSEKVTERFAQTESAQFYLLKFFKDFVLKGPADPAVQQFILNLIELANTHTPIEMTQRIIQRECKTFPVITQTSPVEVIADAEKQLNTYLTQQGCEKWAINFLTVNPTGVTLYVNAGLVLAGYKLMEWSASHYSVHLSPLFVHQLLQLSKTDNQKWSNYNIEKRGEVIKKIMSPRFKVEPQALYSVSCFNQYGYQVKVSKTAYNQIKSASLFPPSSDQKVMNPVEKSILKLLEPLERNLNNYDKVRKPIVVKFIADFKQDYQEKFATIGSPEEAFKAGEKFILQWFTNLAQLPQNIPNFFPSSWLFTSELEKNYNQAVQNIRDLKTSLELLKHQTRTGEIALALHVLPSERPLNGYRGVPAGSHL